MNDQTTPEPPTDDELDAIQQRTDAYGRTGPYGYVINDIEYQGNWVHDIHRLLDEVARLRAQLDQARTESLTLGVSLAETIHERQQLRTRLADAEQTRRAALAVAADLTEDLAEARAETDRQRHEREKYTERWDALDQAATALHDWAGDLADGTRTDWPAGHPDIIRGIRAAADWLDARDRYETETREQLRALVNRHGMADRTCLISDNTTE